MSIFRAAFIAQICAWSLLLPGCSDKASDDPSAEHSSESSDSSGEAEPGTPSGEDDSSEPAAETEPGDPSVEDDLSEPSEENEPSEVDPADTTSEQEETEESEWISEEELSSMGVGKRYRLELYSNVTTGYNWTLQPGMDESVLVLDSSEYVNPESSEGATGAGGSEVFFFRAVGAGTTEVVLHYARPWEPDEFVDEHRFEVTVVE